MKSKWLIEKDVFFENEENFQNAFKKLGIESLFCDDILVKCFKDDNPCFNFNKNDCVVFYGGIASARFLQSKMGWIPGVYCNVNNLRCTSYIPYFGKDMLNNDYIMLPLGDLRRRSEELFNLWGDKIFVRPNSCVKEFPGVIVHRDDYDIDVAFMNSDPSTLIFVSKYKPIQREWRVVVCDKCVITGSQYIKDNDLKFDVLPDTVKDYAQSLIGNWEPDNVWTMDICESENKLYMLEINSFSCAGLYNSNIEKIVESVNRIAVREWSEY
jgi:hypothetical protein